MNSITLLKLQNNLDICSKVRLWEKFLTGALGASRERDYPQLANKRKRAL